MISFKYLTVLNTRTFLILGLVFHGGIVYGKIWPSGCGDDYPSQSSTCYREQRDITYPYECPYKDVQPLNEYNNLIKQLIKKEGYKIWANVHAHPIYDYYQWAEIGDDYGKLFSGLSANNGECIVLTGENTFETAKCDDKNTAICAYPVSRNVQNYCEQYNKICGTTSYCHCLARKGLYCETSCNGKESTSGCSSCEEKFEMYPNPTINLELNEKTITVTVQNILKLYFITSSNVIYCYTDVFEPSETLIKLRYKDWELKNSKISGDVATYTFQIKSNLGPGQYWCEGFLYPEMNIITSNKIIAGDGGYQFNFVLNVTINTLSTSYQKLPYNYHTNTLKIVKTYLDETKIFTIRPIGISENHLNSQNPIVTIHISTKPSEITDIEIIYNDFLDDLENLKAEEIVSYELSSSEHCLTDSILLGETELIWPTTKIGMTVPSLNSILDEPLMRTCGGNFQYGGKWDELKFDDKTTTTEIIDETTTTEILDDTTTTEISDETTTTEIPDETTTTEIPDETTTTEIPDETTTTIWPNGCGDDYPSEVSTCYLEQKDVTYPYECPYRDVKPLNEYSKLVGNLITTPEKKIWANLHAHPIYDYYQWAEIGDDYGKLFSGLSANDGECIVLTGENTFDTAKCDDKNTAICAYPVSRNVQNYCEQYNEICKTTSDCHCLARKGLYCETSCNGKESTSGCSSCEEKFEKYPNPTINLELNEKTIMVTVQNILKLYFITSTNVIYCYTDVFEPSETLIKLRYVDWQLQNSKISGDVATYTFQIKSNLGPGQYWCEGFLYPEMNTITSNKIIAGDGDYQFNFVLNVTINTLSTSYQKLPYNYHTNTLKIVKTYLVETKIFTIRPIGISENHLNSQNPIVTIHISTKPSEITDIEIIYNDFLDDLENLKTEKIVSYELSSSEHCLTDSILLGETELIWPTTKIGMTVPSLNSILDEPLMRTCGGNFQYGGKWDELKFDDKTTTTEIPDETTTTIWPNGCGDDFPSEVSTCYLEQKDVTYPYECPYRDVKPLNEYSKLIGNLITTPEKKIWANLHAHPIYDYYQWAEIGDDYGKLFSGLSANDGECIVLTGENTFDTAKCDDKNTAICAYPVSRNVQNYCEQYNEICKTTSDCHCLAKKGLYCETSCNGKESTSGCSSCEEKFEKYPNPTINLELNEKTIMVTVQNILKLYFITDSNVIYCYTDVFEPSETLIKLRYKDSELKNSKISGDVATYQFQIKSNLGPGQYWCEGFLYPEMNTITSNKIIAGDGDYQFNFVLNVTINTLSKSYQKLPYNYHTNTLEIVKTCLDESKIFTIRPIEITQNYLKNQKLNVILHISTKPSENDLETIYNDFLKDLESLKRDEIVSYESSSSTFCLTETVFLKGTEIVWPTKEIGTTTTPLDIILKPNGEPLTRTCHGDFQYGGKWDEVDYKDINIDEDQEIPDSTTTLHELFSSNKTSNEKNEVLYDILSTESDFTSYDVHLVAEIFHQIVTPNDDFDLERLVANLNMVTKMNRNTLAESQLKLNSTDSLLYNFDVALKGGYSALIIKENIILQIVDLKKSGIIGLGLYKENNKFKPVSLHKNITIDTIPRRNLIFATFIPPELLNEIIKSSAGDQRNLVTTIYLNDALFNDPDTNKKVGYVLSIFIVGFNSISLDYEIPIIFENSYDVNIEKNKATINCAFWNYGIDQETWAGFFGYWKIDETVNFDTTTKTCQFSHMTHFALLVGAEDDIVTNYLASIGAALTLISVLLIFLTAIFSKTWRDAAGTKILLNFSAAIALQMIILVGLSILKEQPYLICTILGISLHYVVISQFCWALIISYLQYRKFVRVLVNEPNSIVIKCSVFAWGTAIIPVLISAYLNIDNYTYENLCYPSGYYLYFGLYLPIIIIVSINVSMFVIIFQNVLNKKSNAFGTETNIILLRIKLGVILFFLMGFSWIFGLIGSFLNSNILLYVFCFTTGIQGVVLYVYFVVWNKGARRMWTKHFSKNSGNASESENDQKTCSTSHSDFNKRH